MTLLSVEGIRRIIADILIRTNGYNSSGRFRTTNKKIIMSDKRIKHTKK
jgi:hypothetical protein